MDLAMWSSYRLPNRGAIDSWRRNAHPSSPWRAFTLSHDVDSLTNRGDGSGILHVDWQRRKFVVLLSSISTLASPSESLVVPAYARERRSTKDIPLESYQTSSDGLKYFDFLEGKGPMAKKGQTVLVHFDCIFHGIDAVSSRESKLLGGNRIIAQPYEFTIGSLPGKERKRDFVENVNGLFSAQAAPKPPPALYSVTEGMRVGGKRTVIVPAELGYGDKGSNEIPPGASFQMNIELLEVKK